MTRLTLKKTQIRLTTERNEKEKPRDEEEAEKQLNSRIQDAISTACMKHDADCSSNNAIYTVT